MLEKGQGQGHKFKYTYYGIFIPQCLRKVKDKVTQGQIYILWYFLEESFFFCLYNVLTTLALPNLLNFLLTLS